MVYFEQELMRHFFCAVSKHRLGYGLGQYCIGASACLVLLDLMICARYMILNYVTSSVIITLYCLQKVNLFEISAETFCTYNFAQNTH